MDASEKYWCGHMKRQMTDPEDGFRGYPVQAQQLAQGLDSGTTEQAVLRRTLNRCLEQPDGRIQEERPCSYLEEGEPTDMVDMTRAC